MSEVRMSSAMSSAVCTYTCLCTPCTGLVYYYEYTVYNMLCRVGRGGVGLRLRSIAHGEAWCPPLLLRESLVAMLWVE